MAKRALDLASAERCNWKSSQKQISQPLSHPICNYCKQSGHIVSDCPVLKKKKQNKNGKSKSVLNLQVLPR